ncbi:MAG: PilN domain-containing protein [Kiritimatiellaceae bacterium]|nr:PilN domain-containing protein [Kiritimatiellaceae bacterium]
MRDKIITAACRTTDGLEWTTLKVKSDGNGPTHQDSLPVVFPDEETEESLAVIQLPEELSDQLGGEVTVALRNSELLMRTMQFPTADPAEIAEMVEFQVDKVSPFPIDQLAVAHEILEYADETALVLMAAAKRDSIDAIGDAFEKKGVRIHSIDARVLGWLQLIRDENDLSDSACEILIIVDGIDFDLVVMHNRQPIAFRSLHGHLDDITMVNELAYEIGYTLTMLDTEYDLPSPSAIHFWTNQDIPAPLRAKLPEKCGLKVHYHDLSILPPLSEGLLTRTLSETDCIELIPREWIEHKQRLKLRKRFTLISVSIAATWVMVLMTFFGVYKARDVKLQAARADADAVAPAARQAEENQKKLKALKVYTDRSDSALECLREVTSKLPAGDIEFISYNFSKEKGVSLKGTGRDKAIVTDFFTTLNKSKLFDGIKNESVNNRTTKGVSRTVFTVTLPLTNQEEIK